MSARFLLSPTVLSDDETAELEAQIASLEGAGTALAAAAARALASNVGFAISPPRRSADPLDVPTGGYETPSMCPLEATRWFRGARPAGDGVPHPATGRHGRDRPSAASDRSVGGGSVLPAAQRRRRQLRRPGGDGAGVGGAAAVDAHRRRAVGLLRMIADGLEADRGAAVVDPHGDLVGAALALVPEHPWDDVVLIEPTDPTDKDPPAVRGPGLYHLVDEASDRPGLRGHGRLVPLQVRALPQRATPAAGSGPAHQLGSSDPHHGSRWLGAGQPHQGLLGEYNARLLGFVVLARLWAATLTRITRP